jgi:hypothetical protein
MENEVSNLLQLAGMSALERYSDQDCSVLLDCTRRDLLAAQTRALQQIGSAAQKQLGAVAGAVVHDCRSSVFEVAALQALSPLLADFPVALGDLRLACFRRWLAICRILLLVAF